jgi:hypothetical protein
MKNKKTFKILAFVALFLLIMFTWVVVKDARNKRIAATPVSTGLQDPFGTGANTNHLPSQENPASTSSGGETVPTIDTTTNTTVTVVEDNPSLRPLSDGPVAGFAFLNVVRELPESNATTSATGLVEVFDFSGYKTIQFGDTADEIVAIKTVLNRQTPSPNLTIDNKYDMDMKNAVVDFQNRNGLLGDGVIGGKTYAKLNAFEGIKTFTSGKKTKPTETVLTARYLDIGSGLVFDKAVRKQETAEKRTSVAIPRVVEAFFDDTANKIVMRYVKDDVIQTYVATLTFAKIDPNLTQAEKDAIPKTANVTGDYLPENIKTVGVSRDHKSMLYIVPTASGVAGTTYTFATKAKKQIFASPLVEWNVDWASSQKIGITTKPTGELPGYAYALDSKTGALKKMTGGENGLTTLMSPDGKKLLYSTYANNALTLSLLDLSTGKTMSVSPSTLPEKCVWTKDSKKIYCAGPTKAVNALYPDDWYQGKMSFDDALWMIEASSGTGNIIYDFISKNNVHIDATNLTLNAAEDYLGFINKKDGILWGFDLAR